jgi:predicted molibdopterin-dependent oxidoreductase YjgC
MAHQLTTCTYCGVGCGLYLETSNNHVIGAYPSVSHPTNQGRICVRGWHVHEIASSPERLKRPLLKKHGKQQAAGWDEAFEFVAAKLQHIRQRHGPDAIAFLNSPRCSNEDSYLLQKFARAVIGTNNVDQGSGVFCNNSIDVLLEMTGVPAATTSIADLAESDVIVVDGVDLGRRLPTVGGAVIRARLRGAKLIVIGTRRHRVAENADLFLQIRPGTEAALYGALAKVIVDRGLMDLGFIKTRCRNYEAFLACLGQHDLLQAAEICGLPAASIEAAATAYAQARAAVVLYSTSMEARTRDSIRAVVNLVLLTGNLGKPGAGILALSEHNNLQGVCDMGMLPDRLPGYRPVTDAGARAELESLWKANLPATPGLHAHSLLANGISPHLKALWLCQYDPASAAGVEEAESLFRSLDFVVTQQLFMTDAARFADVVLPTTAYGEEQVSFTSTERRIQLAQKVIEPAPALTPVWQQLTRLACMLGASWAYRSAGEVMEEIGEAVPFYGGATYENLAREYGRQWPCTKDRPLGIRYLFAENGNRTKFTFAALPKQVQPSSAANFPFKAFFGSSLYYWAQDVLVRHSETLKREYRLLWLDYPQGFVEINSTDAKQLGIRDGQKITLRTATASAEATARVTPEVMSGTIFVPYFLREVEKKLLNEVADRSQLLPVRVEKEAA